MLEKTPRGQHTVVDKYAAPVANYAMTVRDYIVRFAADGVTGPFAIQLPPVVDAMGKWYSLVCRNADPVNFVTVMPSMIGGTVDAECWPGNMVFNGKCDECLYYSDGLKWWSFCTLTYAGTSTPPTTAASPTSAAP